MFGFIKKWFKKKADSPVTTTPRKDYEPPRYREVIGDYSYNGSAYNSDETNTTKRKQEYTPATSTSDYSEAFVSFAVNHLLSSESSSSSSDSWSGGGGDSSGGGSSGDW